MSNAALKPAKKGMKLSKSLKRIQALYNKNRLKEAKPLCDWVYSQNIRNPDFLHMYGLVLRACGDPNEALVKIFAAHEQLPSDARILNSLGLVFLDLKDLETAITMFKRATAANEKYYDAWGNLAISLRQAERYSAAELAFKCAYFLDRSNPGPLFDIALMQVDVRRYGRAAEIMDELLDTHENITTAMKLKRLQIAMRLEDLDYVKVHMESFDRSLLTLDEQADLDAVHAQYNMIYDRVDDAITILEGTISTEATNRLEHMTHLGFMYGLVGRTQDGIQMLREVLELAPEDAAARCNLGLLQFNAGELSEAFQNYEARWQLPEFPSKRRIFDAPSWQGEPLEGKNLLVWREQGLGDEVCYASLIPELKELGGSVTFECMPKLVPLWKQAFPWATIQPEGDGDCIGNPDYQKFDYQIALASLGRIFRNSISDFDENQKPWIARDHDVESRIRHQLAIKGDEILIGVCWRSSNQTTVREKSFLKCEELAPLKELPSTRWLNVQYASNGDELDRIRESGLALHHYDDLDQMNDLVGACNLLGACDLVISVGVSVGDLTGGVGTPMIHLLPEISRLYLGTDDVPWFVNSRTYKIKEFHAADTIPRIINDWNEIAEWVKNHEANQRPPITQSNTELTKPELTLDYSSVRSAS